MYVEFAIVVFSILITCAVLIRITESRYILWELITLIDDSAILFLLLNVWVSSLNLAVIHSPTHLHFLSLLPRCGQSAHRLAALTL